MIQPLRAGPRRTAVLLALALAATGALSIGLVCAPRDLLTLSRQAYARGSYREAADLARKRLFEAPLERDALRLLARASGRLGQDRALESIYRQLGPEGSQAEDHFLIGISLLRRDANGPALRMLEQARESDPNHTENLNALAQEYARRDMEIASIDAARDLARQPGWDAQAAAILGHQLLKIDDPDAAATALARALEPSEAGGAPALELVAGRKLLARALLRSGRPAEARAALHKVLAAGTDHEASWLLSRACLQEHDAVGAIAAIEQARTYADDLDPTTPEPAPYVGPSRCAGCHDSILRSQQASRHAHTLGRPAELAATPPPEHAIPDPGDSRVSHALKPDATHTPITVQAEGGPQLEALIDYLVGSGNRGKTPIVRDPYGTHYEYRLSYYTGGAGWELTFHHPQQPDGDYGFLGRRLLPDNVHGCLACHSTSARAVRDGVGPTASETGIGCERCHGPAGNHLAAVAIKFPDLAIARPKIATGPQRDALCAGCHEGAGGTDSSADLIRFQSPSLARSRCYTESYGALDCISCHNPHQNAETSPAFYESICLRCHTPTDAVSKGPEPNGSPRLPQTECPVSPARDCLTCHMPPVAEVFPHTSYTDHFIRIRQTPAPAD